MAATRSMAVASPTEVPPNFMTMGISRRDSQLSQRRRKVGHPMARRVPARSRQVSLHFQQFGVEPRSSGRPANRIVREHGEFPVKHAAGAQLSYSCGHAVTTIHVESWLWAIARIQVQDWNLRSAGESLFLRNAAESRPRAKYLCRLGFVLQFH